MLEEEILSLFKFLSNRGTATNVNADLEVVNPTYPINYKRFDSVRIKAKNFKYYRKTRIVSNSPISKVVVGG
jgi:hypothetical protein